ncbi:ATP-grasp fold amidoligase family protein [Planomicrobium okeanokoites]|uniref:ATP-grasp fold amidoligase family protein n=1 Tax=Planomicrobium okeanokoites TaxID=244 RepID=UPI0015C4B947|nr:ATP-grasp fold amidoligase family protein [Planomicrobium okeanokoites]
MLKKNDMIVKHYDKTRDLYYKKFISDEKLIKRKFKKKLKRKLEVEKPILFNDKLQWLKIHWRDSQATQCADKYEVRKYVEEKIGGKYLNKIIDVYNSVDEIDVEKLPNSFVLKGTHGSGFNIICQNKESFNWDIAVKEMKRWFNTNYYLRNREWVYKDIRPRIICEEFIEHEENNELIDYRFFCFNGEPRFISVDFDINNKQNTKRNLYDLEWNLMDQEISYPKELSKKIEKPKKLSEMIELSRKLAAHFPHARIDFYYVRNKILFGEITFFHQSGMGIVRPLEFEKVMGDWLKLPHSEL